MTSRSARPGARSPARKPVSTPRTQDAFASLRREAEDELKKLHMSDEADRQKMWQKIDSNGNGTVDLVEVQALVTDMVKTGNWPNWVTDEQSLKRAFEKTLQDGDGDDTVNVKEFHDLLTNIFWFGKVHELFNEIDTEDDISVDLKEFTAGLSKLGLKLGGDQIGAEFKSIDKSGDGLVDFGEFCMYIRSKCAPSPGHSGETNHDRVKSECHAKVLQQPTKGGAPPPSAGLMVKKKAWGDFAELEAKIQKLIADSTGAGLKKMWKSLDFNGNNVVSLAEIDKMVVEQYPLLNHKPSLMRAYKATVASNTSGQTKDDFVHKMDFKILMTNLFYYNKLFWVFDQADEGRDRRMDAKEFQFMMTMCGMNLAPAKASAEFAKIDKNGGGQILFDEFCEYFVQKKCPDGLTAFIATAD